jgi:hypothetical protein
MSVLQMGSVYRYGRPYSHAQATVDGLPNYFHAVYTADQKLPLLEAGINPIRVAAAVDGRRRPAILISSSPHKIGSEETPWQDSFDSDNGVITYYGDNKTRTRDAADAPGNELLLDALRAHTSPDPAEREVAIPLVFFQRVIHAGRTKGQVRFHGFGIVTGAERVTQVHRKNRIYFSNYRFEFAVLSLSHENEQFDWSWIDARRDTKVTAAQTASLAPKAWRDWLKGGPTVLDKCRRRVSKLLVTAASEQRPAKGSREERVLREVYAFYHGRKARFEALASVITASIVSRSGGMYHEGWVTPGSSDEGIDFVGRIDIGAGFARTKLVVLGQAKCESPTSATGGINVARTVARLRRGWIGAYVTTSFFSDKVQREILDDQYPIMLIHGLDLATEVDRLTLERGFGTVADFLKEVDRRYEAMIRQRRAEEILHE